MSIKTFISKRTYFYIFFFLFSILSYNICTMYIFVVGLLRWIGSLSHAGLFARINPDRLLILIIIKLYIPPLNIYTGRFDCLFFSYLYKLCHHNNITTTIYLKYFIAHNSKHIIKYVYKQRKYYYQQLWSSKYFLTTSINKFNYIV